MIDENLKKNTFQKKQKQKTFYEQSENIYKLYHNKTNHYETKKKQIHL